MADTPCFLTSQIFNLNSSSLGDSYSDSSNFDQYIPSCRSGNSSHPSLGTIQPRPKHEVADLAPSPLPQTFTVWFFTAFYSSSSTILCASLIDGQAMAKICRSLVRYQQLATGPDSEFTKATEKRSDSIPPTMVRSGSKWISKNVTCT